MEKSGIQCPFNFRLFKSTTIIRALNHISSVPRHIVLRIARCYRTVSYAAEVFSISPLALLAEEKIVIYKGTNSTAGLNLI